MVIMLNGSCYTFEGESPFVEREEIHEIFKEIHGDPIYDVYEDDVLVIDFIFEEGSFKNLVRANVGQKQICAKIGFNQFRASFMEDLICAKFGRFQICSEGVQNPVRAYLGFYQVCAKSEFYQKNGFEDVSKKTCMVKTLLKIRGRIFLGRGNLMQRRYKIRGRIFLGWRDLMQRRIRIIPFDLYFNYIIYFSVYRLKFSEYSRAFLGFLGFFINKS